MEKRTEGSCEAVGGQLTIGIDLRLIETPHAPGDCKRLEERHQCDRQRAGNKFGQMIERR